MDRTAPLVRKDKLVEIQHVAAWWSYTVQGTITKPHFEIVTRGETVFLVFCIIHVGLRYNGLCS
jgi:hypothetical protein